MPGKPPSRVPRRDLSHQLQKKPQEYVYLDDDEPEPVFHMRARTVIDMNNSLGPVFRSQRMLSRPGLQELLSETGDGDRHIGDKIIRDAFKRYASTQSKIADFPGQSRSAISKVICKSNGSDQELTNSGPDPPMVTLCS